MNIKKLIPLSLITAIGLWSIPAMAGLHAASRFRGAAIPVDAPWVLGGIAIVLAIAAARILKKRSRLDGKCLNYLPKSQYSASRLCGCWPALGSF